MNLLSVLCCAVALSTASARDGRGALKYYWVAHNETEPRVDLKRFGTTQDSHVALNTNNEFRVFRAHGFTASESSAAWIEVESDRTLYPAVADDKYVVLTENGPNFEIERLLRGLSRRVYSVCLDQESRLYATLTPPCNDVVEVTVALENPIPEQVAPGQADNGYGSSGLPWVISAYTETLFPLATGAGGGN